MLLLINTVGGDVSAGLALAEMIASMDTPTVSLVLGDAHSIGVPLTVSADYSFIAPTATMIVHPVRMNGTIIGAPQTFDYFKMIQDRIVNFICGHAGIETDTLEKMMIKAGVLTKDLGTILVGKEAVEAGLVNEVGGINKALHKLRIVYLIKDTAICQPGWWWQGRHCICGRNPAYQEKKAPVQCFFQDVI